MKVRLDKIAVFIARPGAESGTHEFLQLHRTGADEVSGTWQTVRGTIEAGEIAVAAAIRELREETGIRPAEFYRLGTIETFYDISDDTVVHSVPFLACVERDATVTINDEHDAIRWVAAADANAAFMWPSEKPLLREIQSEILGAGGLAKPRLVIKL